MKGVDSLLLAYHDNCIHFFGVGKRGHMIIMLANGVAQSVKIEFILTFFARLPDENLLTSV